MKKELVIDRKTFVGKDNKEITYFDMYVILEGKKFKLGFKDNYKQFGNYILNKEYK